jgi:beige protein homolog 1
MLDALKGETFSEDVFPDFLEAFSTLLRCNTSAENLRSVALFVTYALQDGRAFPGRTSRLHKNGQRQSNNQTPVVPRIDPFARLSDSPAEANHNDLSSHEVGVRLLQMYTEFLCDTTSLESIKKFAKTVANKVRSVD